MPPDTTPRKVGWKPVRNLGAGGQGFTDVVCRSDDPEKQEFIRKRLKNIDDPARRARFESELKAYQTLAHENVLRLVDFDLSGPRLCIVSEYCRRGSLDRGGWTRGTVLEVLRDFRQVCRGVAYAHEYGVIHRDIKPANIFLREDGSLVVGDFGLCLLDEEGVRVTATEEVVGSRFYTAPELADGRADQVRPSCDVYSLGKLLYWMLTGKIFDREKHREDEWRFGRGSLPLPEYELVNQLLDRMIAVDPSQRHQSAAVTLAAVEDLKRWQRKRPSR
jgi:serine/threonine protein kinase